MVLLHRQIRLELWKSMLKSGVQCQLSLHDKKEKMLDSYLRASSTSKLTLVVVLRNTFFRSRAVSVSLESQYSITTLFSLWLLVYAGLQKRLSRPYIIQFPKSTSTWHEMCRISLTQTSPIATSSNW